MEITTDAKLIVRAPLSIKNDYIRKLVEQKRSWIRKKQLEIARRNETCLRHHRIDGESLMFLGDSYRIEYSGQAQAQSVSIQNGTVIISAGRKDEAIDLIREWYIKEAQRIFEERTEYWAAVSGIVYKSVRTSKAAKRWGSCGVKCTLNFSFCLIMAPLRVVDYVVVHELVHVEFRNHSKEYWARVRAIMPDYKEQKKWLKENQVLVAIR